MKIRRWSTVGLAATLLVPGLTACKQPGAESTGSAASPSASVSASASTAGDPKQALLDSTKEISNGNYRFTIASGQSTSEGMVNQASHSASLKTALGQPGSDLAMTLDVIYVAPETWAKVNFNGNATQTLPALKQLATGKYLHLDPTKAKNIKDPRLDFTKVDPAGSKALAEAVTDVKRTGDGAYAGTIDLSKATEGQLADQTLIATLGAQAKTLPFQAQVDPQGRLSKLTIQVPATAQTKAQELTVSYSDYGSTSPAQKPLASETQEAPAELYQLFNK